MKQTISISDSLDTAARKFQCCFGYDFPAARDYLETIIQYYGWTRGIIEANNMIKSQPFTGVA